VKIELRRELIALKRVASDGNVAHLAFYLAAGASAAAAQQTNPLLWRLWRPPSGGGRAPRAAFAPSAPAAGRASVVSSLMDGCGLGDLLLAKGSLSSGRAKVKARRKRQTPCRSRMHLCVLCLPARQNC